MEANGPERLQLPNESFTTQKSKRVQLMSVTNQALLHTAVVYIRGSNGELQKCRAVLDSCAMSTFMTTACARRLRLKTFSSNVSVIGFGGTGKKILEATVAQVKSKSSYFSSFAEFLVTPNITSKLPLQMFDIANCNIPEWIDSADPQFNQPAKIDILFGILEWDKMVLSKTYKVGDGLPTLRQTVFGWVAGGQVSQRGNYPVFSEQVWSSEELAAEDHFVSTHRRDKHGRYIVSLPFKNPDVELGDSSHIAHRRFLRLEARLVKDQQLYNDYKEFMQEYMDMGHMKRVGTYNPADPVPEACYFMPHHAVVRPESSTTKVRIVFDASAKTSNGQSLNDQLMVGPTLQPRLIDTLLSFRTYKVAVTCDVSKMFRQIIVREDDRQYQQILWRSAINEEIGIYQLTTVTYGTACAPFLATRTLFQICEDESENFPLAAKFGKGWFYVDDALLGAETEQEVLELREQLIGMLGKAGFDLHKWCSNRVNVLAGLPTVKLEQKVLFSEEGRTKNQTRPRRFLLCSIAESL
ncbi:uncharacterized protein LOC129764188 [Toxorhynchites rutilus septentrionalis]|uniref:uncharacterized protein LOC129764188 n=1 Tax=Toxorhynchites rutilus septentrionalis TaxID=329112 RepID=UPI00247A9C17|nr:uncharacterized protein LOC129764188 [Toxorhynchites rutilus septentrionalis]